jgi:hypothetical protein
MAKKSGAGYLRYATFGRTDGLSLENLFRTHLRPPLIEAMLDAV